MQGGDRKEYPEGSSFISCLNNERFTTTTLLSFLLLKAWRGSLERHAINNAF